MELNPHTCDAINTILHLLEPLYPIEPWQPGGDPLDELILTILSQNTTDSNCYYTYQAMRHAFPTWNDVLDAPRTALEAQIRPAGLAHMRSQRIQTILRTIKQEHGSLSLSFLEDLSDAEAEAWLLRFDGVGRKTARCVLLFAMGRDVFPIDTHILRILRRMGILPSTMDAGHAHVAIQALIPAGTSYALHLRLITHGRRICTARNPACGDCVLLAICAHRDSLVSAPGGP